MGNKVVIMPIDTMKETKEDGIASKIERHDVEIKQLATGLAVLTSDVRDLTHAVSTQTQSTAKQFSDVLVAIKEVSSPKPIDKQLIISFIMLIITIGALIFIPMNWRQSETQKDIDETRVDFKNHQSLTLHPVGAEKIDALGQSLKEKSILNTENIKSLENKLQIEMREIHDSLKDVQANGSPVARERLSLLEEKVSRLEKSLEKLLEKSSIK